LLFIEKQYKALLFLLIGSIFFNTMGWIIENEPLWIISSNPYLKIGLTDNPLYGQGEWYHYARWSNVLFGMINSILLLAGIVILIWRYLNDVRNRQLKAFFFLIAGIFCAYFAAHSIIWWKGWMGSAGLVRVMLVVSPLAALLAVQAIEYSSTFLRERWKTVFGFLFMVNAVYAPFKYNSYKYPLELSNEQKLYDQMLSWLQKQEFNTRTWAYMYPYLSLQTNRDPWNRNEHEELWMTSIPYYKEGTILIWDAHFGPNEAGIPLEMLLESENFRLIKSFKPKVQFKVLNNYDFEIYVFEKLSETES
jgi:hypothetical protein